MTDRCGYPTANDTPCQHPVTDDGDPDRCYIDAHNESDTDPATEPGRPNLLDDERKQQIIYTAVNSGLSIEHQANLAQVDPDTLRRALCCVKTPREPQLTTEEPCEFCEGYAQAHARGAMNVLDECRPEFRASASFGYVEKKEQEVDMDADHTFDTAEGVTAEFVTYENGEDDDDE